MERQGLYVFGRRDEDCSMVGIFKGKHMKDGFKGLDM